jgi:hypothetical protein
VAADGRTAVMMSDRSGVQSLWLSNFGTGTASQIVKEFVPGRAFDISQDGTMLLYLDPGRDVGPRVGAVICRLPDCSNPRTVMLPPRAWTNQVDARLAWNRVYRAPGRESDRSAARWLGTEATHGIHGSGDHRLRLLGGRQTPRHLPLGHDERHRPLQGIPVAPSSSRVATDPLPRLAQTSVAV